MNNLTIRLPVGARRKLEAAAVARGVSLGEFIRREALRAAEASSGKVDGLPPSTLAPLAQIEPQVSAISRALGVLISHAHSAAEQSVARDRATQLALAQISDALGIAAR